MKSLFSLTTSIATLFIACTAQGQGLPFGSLSGEALQTTLQIENLGPSLYSERSQTVGHSRFEISVPVAQSDVDAYAVQLRATRLTLDRDRSMPRDLGSVALGPFARRKLESGDIIAGDIQVGRAGVQLGSNDTETTVSANFFWARKKDDSEGQWIYLLSYSNSRSSFNNIPFPGFAYVKSFKSEATQGLWAAGAPFFFTMIRSQPWSFSALLTPFTSFVESGYSFAGPFGMFVRFGWQPQAFKVANGPKERVVYEEFRTLLGVRGPISRAAMLSIGAAYSDGRRVAWGESVFKSNVLESRLDDEVSFFASLNARF